MARGQSCLARVLAIDLRRTVVVLVLRDPNIFHQVVSGSVSEITSVELETDDCARERLVLQDRKLSDVAYTSDRQR